MTATNLKNWPTTETLFAALDHARGKNAYVVSMTDREGITLGNNGDALMHWVFDKLLAELRIERVGRDQAEIVIVPPNGALLEIYQFPKILAERLIGLEDVPIVIFPSSAKFDNVSPAFIFRGRRASTLWVFREQYSFDLMRSRWAEDLESVGVRLLLDHDVVASGHRFVVDLFESTPRRFAKRPLLLVGARTDVEAGSLDAEPSPAPVQRVWWKGLARRVFFSLPRGMRTRLARLLFRTRLHRSAQKLLARAEQSGYALIEPITREVDISATEFATFNEYRSIISRATTVVSDRLHIALPAAILGKRVVMVEAGYHKLEGVYRQSLADVPNVSLVV
ncbi:hypothetical protein N3K63_01875 [Microbacterium sp. W1N]|uniref:hypothetical protein n=1 Tax=Microbacterium festucae TaxID=2977531 RepID=UPI0021C18B9A|nr:hypothetical protein [Microbacterium festucae]MCT9819029.1 hypothetical protein [Microbacterium festucae]